VVRENTFTGRDYAEAVAAAGGVPLLAPTLDAGLATAFEGAADGLLLSGGVDVDPALYGAQPQVDLGAVDRERDVLELALYRAFRASKKPILGICRGIQLVNVAEGGTLHQHLPAVPGTQQHRQADRIGAPLHAVTLESDSRLAVALGRAEVRTNSYHHQALDRLGDGLRAVGRSADGVVEALEGRDGAFLLAVQWHPELCWRTYPEHHAPFRMVVEATRSRGTRLMAPAPA